MPFTTRTGCSRRTLLTRAALPAAVAAAVGFRAGAAGPPAAAQDEPTAEPEPTPFPGRAAPQPSYDTLRLEDGGAIVPYHVWVDWLPALVTTPDGGGWVFFGAQARTAQGPGGRRLYAARFDPKTAVWLPATPMPGGVAQFGPSAAVDSRGGVHVVYSDVAEPGELGSTLVYTRSTERGWAEAAAVAPHPDAGYQMMADLAVDAADGLHVVWRDQRLATAEARAAHPANGDLFVSTLAAAGWSEPVGIFERPTAAAVAGWPHLAADGDRMVAVWSIYAGTAEEDMRSAERIVWASRAADGGWSPASVLLERPATREIGGRLIDVTADPRGGIVAVYGSYERASNELAARWLSPGSGEWSAPLPIGTGDYGYLPAAGVRADGTLFVAFNAGRNRNVEVGALAVRPDGSVAEPVTLTPAEDGLQARAVVAVGADGAPWVVYMHQPPGETAVPELRVVRQANLLGDGA